MNLPVFIFIRLAIFILTLHRASSIPQQNDEQIREEVRENFFKLFNSIAVNDTTGFKHYKMLLAHKAAKENQAFFSMKEEVKRTRTENGNKRILPRLKKSTEHSTEFESENESADHSHRSQFVSDNMLEESKSASATKSSDRNFGNPSSGTSTNVTLEYQLLPILDDTFQDLQDGRKIFVDKSKFLEYLLDEGETFYFMARPQGFGKTVFLQMMCSFFKGEQQYFKNLTIYARGNNNVGGGWVKYPVIYLDFNELDAKDCYIVTDFANSVRDRLLKTVEVNYKLKYSKKVPLSSIMADLQKQEGHSVVILIDNYDIGVQRALSEGNRKLARDMQNYLKQQFFATIKKCAFDLQLVFVTGKFKLALDGLYDGVDNFIDLTHDTKFANAMGLTKNELDSDALRPFIDELGLCENMMMDINQCKGGMTKEECQALFMDEERCKQGLKEEECIDWVNESRGKLIERLHQWYGGYMFAPNREKLVNPFSIFECLRRKEMRSHRKKDDALNFVAREFRRNNHRWTDFVNFRTTGRAMFQGIELEGKISLPVEMLMIGMLTIKSYDELSDELILDYSNEDFRKAIRKAIGKKENDPHHRHGERFRNL